MDDTIIATSAGLSVEAYRLLYWAIFVVALLSELVRDPDAPG